MAVSPTLTILITAFERTNKKFHGFRQTDYVDFVAFTLAGGFCQGDTVELWTYFSLQNVLSHNYSIKFNVCLHIVYVYLLICDIKYEMG